MLKILACDAALGHGACTWTIDCGNADNDYNMGTGTRWAARDFVNLSTLPYGLMLYIALRTRLPTCICGVTERVVNVCDCWSLSRYLSDPGRVGCRELSGFQHETKYYQPRKLRGCNSADLCSLMR